MSVASGTEGYAENAAALAISYEKLRFEDVHRDVLRLLPHGPGLALDIGAGTGRDAAALAARGFRVVAVEPTEAFRRHGQQVHAGADIEWVDDALPELSRVLALGRRFDLVMLTAVWMHLDEAQRRTAMGALARVLAPGGRAVLLLRHGPVPAGRRMFDVSGDETAALAHAAGLRTIHRGAREDMMGRADVSWTFLVLEAPPHQPVS